MLDNAAQFTEAGLRLQPIRLGGVTLRSPVVLAPMSGVTDRPFRRIVRKFGAELVVTEMLASKAVVREHRKTLRMAEHEAGDGLLAVQLAGREPEIMAEAARLNEDRGADIIDLNFGCPVKKVVKDLVGAALMRDEAHAAKIFEAVVKAVKLPVTLKMRMGWSPDDLNAPHLAKIAEECGIVMVTVHGRTRAQFYGGEADWGFVRPGQASGFNSRTGERGHSQPRRCGARAGAVRGRWRDDRARGLWTPLAHRTGGGVFTRERRAGRAGAARAVRNGGGTFRGDAGLLRRARGGADRAEASWLVQRGAAGGGGVSQRG